MTSRLLSLTLCLLLGLTGCTVANTVVSPYDKLTLIGQSDMNPDINERPSPVHLRVFHLRSRDTFDNLDFDQLFFNARELLSDELLLAREYTLQPDQVLQDKLLLADGVRHVAIVAAYRNIDQSRWRHVEPVSDSGYYRHRFTLGRDGIFSGRVKQKQPAARDKLHTAGELLESTNSALDTVDQGKTLKGKLESY